MLAEDGAHQLDFLISQPLGIFSSLTFLKEHVLAPHEGHCFQMSNYKTL